MTIVYQDLKLLVHLSPISVALSIVVMMCPKMNPSQEIGWYSVVVHWWVGTVRGSLNIFRSVLRCHEIVSALAKMSVLFSGLFFHWTYYILVRKKKRSSNGSVDRRGSGVSWSSDIVSEQNTSHASGNENTEDGLYAVDGARGELRGITAFSTMQPLLADTFGTSPMFRLKGVST